MNKYSKRVVEHSEPQNNNMKKIISYITVIASAFVLSTNAAEAKPHQGHSAQKAHPSSKYISVYKKVFSHYDRHGHAIYTYKKVTIRKNNTHYNSNRKNYSSKPHCVTSYNQVTTRRR